MSLAADINPTAFQGSNPSGFQVVGNDLYFVAEPEWGSYELFRVDGETGGVGLAADVSPGASSSGPYAFILLGNNVYSMAYTEETGYEPHRLDGATGTVTLVADVYPGEIDASVPGFAVLGRRGAPGCTGPGPRTTGKACQLTGGEGIRQPEPMFPNFTEWTRQR